MTDVQRELAALKFGFQVSALSLKCRDLVTQMCDIASKVNGGCLDGGDGNDEAQKDLVDAVVVAIGLVEGIADGVDQLRGDGGDVGADRVVKELAEGHGSSPSQVGSTPSVGEGAPGSVDIAAGPGGAHPVPSLHGWEATAARLGGVSRTTLFALWASGELGSVVIGSRRFSSDKQIAEFIERLEGQS